MQKRRILEVLAAKYMESKREKDAVKVSSELLKLIPEGIWCAPYYKRAAAAAQAAGQTSLAGTWTARYELLTRPESPAK